MLPQFLCIGAQKAGTTWLYHNLRGHPAVWSPPLKEIFYFCSFRVGADGTPGRASRLPLLIQLLLPRNRELRQLVGDAIRKARGRKPPAAGTVALAATPPARPPASSAPPPPSPAKPAVVPAVVPAANPAAARRSRWRDALWLLHYVALPRTDRWYAGLFRPGAGQIAGDITPYYANLGAERVARIHALLPNAKVIYILRNPIERLWSEAGMASRRAGEKLAEAEADALKSYLRKRHAARLTDYLDNVKTWRRYYPAEQVHVGFFDELVEDPAGFLAGIHRFLGVESSSATIPEDVAAKRNAGAPSRIPPYWAAFLAELFGEQVEALHEYFDSPYTARWVEFTREHAPRADQRPVW